MSHVDVDWADMPPAVREWYVAQLEKQEAAQRAAHKLELDRGQWVLRRDPMAPEPLTRPDGSVVYRDPVIHSEPERKDVIKARNDYLKRQMGLE